MKLLCRWIQKGAHQTRDYSKLVHPRTHEAASFLKIKADKCIPKYGVLQYAVTPDNFQHRSGSKAATDRQLSQATLSAGSVQALQPALTGAKAVVCTGRLGNLLQAAEQQRLYHIVVVSSAG